MNVLLLSIVGHEDIIEEPGISSIAGYLISQGHNVNVLQINNNDCINQIADFSPQLIGISTYDTFFQRQIEFSKLIKDSMPNVYICLGGYTASYHSVSILESYEYIDFIIRGEGELAINQLADALESKKSLELVGNLTYRKDGIITENPLGECVKDLNSLPYSDRSYISRYNLDMVQLATSRGCTRNCSFCCSSDYWRDQNGKRAYRRMNSKRVVDEIEYIYSKYNKTNFTFNDNSYEDPNNDLSRQIEIAEEIIRRDLRINYNINYRTGFYKHVTDEFMKLMLKSGLSSIFIGIDAGNEEDLILYNKRYTLSDCDDALNYYQRFDDLAIRMGFINLNPYSTPEKLYKNIGFLERHMYAYDICLFTNKFRPYKGTGLFDAIERDNLLIGDVFHGGYDFKYKDKRMIDIEKHLFMQVEKIEQELKGLRYLCEVYPVTLLQLKRETVEMADDVLINLQREAYNQYYSVACDLNTQVASWIRSLVELLEKGWDEKEAELISWKYLNDHNILEMYKQLRKNRNKLYVNMLRRNSYFQNRF